jgi:16S rRNA (cytosine967-C5)-methyltransferase
MADPRRLAHALLERVARDGAFAERLLVRAGSTPGLTGRDRALLTELVYGCLRHRRWLDSQLQSFLNKPLHKLPPAVHSALLLGAYQLLCMRVSAHGAVHSTVNLLPEPRLRGLCNAVLRKLCDLPSHADRPVPTTLTEMACLLSLPYWLAEEILAQRGSLEEVYAWGLACLQPPGVNLRINRLKVALPDLLDSLAAAGVEAHPAKLAGDANLSVPRGGAPDQLPGFAEGLITVQDPAATWAVDSIVLAEDPGLILDLCAAPGGKTGHLAERFPSAQLLAVDLHPKRLARVEASCARLGHAQVQTAAFDAVNPEPIAAHLTELYGRPSADLVVLDAPCSGMGTLRRHVELRLRDELPEQTGLLDLQRRLLDSACCLLAPGGSLLYCVCSPVRTEGEGQVAGLLGRQSDLELVASRQLWTDQTDSDSFFVALLRRGAPRGVEP